MKRPCLQGTRHHHLPTLGKSALIASVGFFLFLLKKYFGALLKNPLYVGEQHVPTPEADFL